MTRNPEALRQPLKDDVDKEQMHRMGQTDACSEKSCAEPPYHAYEEPLPTVTFHNYNTLTPINQSPPPLPPPRLGTRPRSSSGIIGHIQRLKE